MKALTSLLLALPLAMSAVAASAQDVKEYALTIKDNRFEPTELRVPANARIKLVISNRDAAAEEFESKTMKLEQVVPAGKSATLFAGPLKPGRYPFEGEFHSKTARGVVIAE